jgi:hypothetical protein
MGLDGDAPFPFQVHGIEELLLHFASGDGAGAVEEAVGKSRLPMINMGDDAEISYMCGVHCASRAPNNIRMNPPGEKGKT